MGWRRAREGVAHGVARRRGARGVARCPPYGRHPPDPTECDTFCGRASAARILGISYCSRSSSGFICKRRRWSGHCRSSSDPFCDHGALCVRVLSGGSSTRGTSRGAACARTVRRFFDRSWCGDYFSSTSARHSFVALTEWRHGRERVLRFR